MKVITRSVLAALSLCLALGSTALFAKEIEERFDTKSDEAGSRLNGLPAGSGDLNWLATDNLRITQYEGGSCVAFANAEAGLAQLPVSEDATSISVEARLWPRQLTEGKVTWLAVGLGNPSKSRKDITWSHGVFLLINTSGFFEFFRSDAGGQLTKLADGAAPKFKKTDFNSVRFDYTKKDNSIQLFVNDVPYDHSIPLDSSGSDFEPVWAGFSGGGQPADLPSVGGFTLKTTP